MPNATKVRFRSREHVGPVIQRGVTRVFRAGAEIIVQVNEVRVGDLGRCRVPDADGVQELLPITGVEVVDAD